MNSKNREVDWQMNNKNLKGTLKRLVSYVLKGNEFKLAVVVICVFLSAMGSVSISLALKILIDDYITPLIGQTSPDFKAFYSAISILCVVFAVSVISSFTYNRIMVYVAQGTLRKVKDDMFAKMQSLPISYFDKNSDGSIMSLYTTDDRAVHSSGNVVGCNYYINLCYYVGTFAYTYSACGSGGNSLAAYY